MAALKGPTTTSSEHFVCSQLGWKAQVMKPFESVAVCLFNGGCSATAFLFWPLTVSSEPKVSGPQRHKAKTPGQEVPI